MQEYQLGGGQIEGLLNGQGDPKISTPPNNLALDLATLKFNDILTVFSLES